MGEIEGNAIQAPYRTQSLILEEKKKKRLSDRDSLFEEVARFIVTQSQVSITSIQRKYEIGFNRAGKIMDQLETMGIVGPSQSGKPHEVLVNAMDLEALLHALP